MSAWEASLEATLEEDQVLLKRRLDEDDEDEDLRLRFILMGRDGFGNHLDLHAGERLRGINEPLHLGFLRAPVERRHVADLGVQERLGFVHASIGVASAEK